MSWIRIALFFVFLLVTTAGLAWVLWRIWRHYIAKGMEAYHGKAKILSPSATIPPVIFTLLLLGVWQFILMLGAGTIIGLAE